MTKSETREIQKLNAILKLAPAARAGGSMKTYILFGRHGDFITAAPTLIRAVQAAILARGGVARDWIAHDLATYPTHLQARLLREVAA